MFCALFPLIRKRKRYFFLFLCNSCRKHKQCAKKCGAKCCKKLYKKKITTTAWSAKCFSVKSLPIDKLGVECKSETVVSILNLIRRYVSKAFAIHFNFMDVLMWFGKVIVSHKLVFPNSLPNNRSNNNCTCKPKL